MAQRSWGGVLPEVAIGMAICTVVLSAAFVGIFGLTTGLVVDPADRLPYYVVVLGLSFLATIVVFEAHGGDGRAVFANAIVISVATFTAVALAVEGVIVALEHPGEVFSSRLVFYVVAASMIASGLGYWGIRHWREFTPSGSSL